MEPTKEQKDIVRAAVNGESIRVDAVAGSGKTFSSVLVAEAVNKRVLYLAYNKSLASEGESKFRKSATVRTTHSMAYRGLDIGSTYFKSKLGRTFDRNPEYCVTFTDMVSYLKPSSVGSYFGRFDVVRMAKDSVARFQNSDSTEIGKQHCYGSKNSFESCKVLVKNQLMQGVSETDEQYGRRIDREARDLVDESVRKVFSIAKKLWNHRIDENSKCRIDHDTYLKMYQLSLAGVDGPWDDFSKYKIKFDMVILDEAQDTNGCVLDIVRRFDVQTVAVGDKRQAIYGWRGAENAMESLDYPALRLSRSWRFGPEIASLATKILRSDNYDWDVYGNEDLISRVGLIGDDQKTYLGRTNAGVIERALDFIDEGEDVRIEIEASKIGRLIVDCAHIRAGHGDKVKTPELKPYADDWDLLKELSESDMDLGRVVSIVSNREMDECIEIGNKLDNYKKPRKARYTFCTAHKSKGLEWGNVVLCDDFPSKNSDDKRAHRTEEINLLYVAATRCQKVLEPNDAVSFYLEEGVAV